MVRVAYPSEPVSYPTEPVAFPGDALVAYPDDGLVSYPVGSRVIDVSQSLAVDSSAATLGVITISQGVVADGTGATPPIAGPTDPLTIVTSVSWAFFVSSDLETTLAGTPTAAGSSPPAVTLTGTRKFDGLGFYCEVTGGGTTFKYGTNNGSFLETGVTLTAGGTHSCTGVLTGLTINFPAGTYLDAQNWTGGCSTWEDQSNSNHLTAASSAVS